MYGVLGEVVAVVFEAAGVGAPVFIYLDEELEEDRFLEELLDILSCQRSDPLEGRSGFADEDTFLRLAFAVDDGIDADDMFFFVERLHFDLDGIRYLLVVGEQDLLAYDLVDKEAFGLIGQLVFGEEGFTDRQGLFDGIEELCDAEALLRRDGEYLCLRQLGIE